MFLPDPHGHHYYTAFYLLATLTNVLLLLWEGWRRGFPLRPWLTLVAASSLALVLGTKLITHPVGEWAAVLFSDAPLDTARSILGGSLAAGLTVLALRRWLGLSRAVLDALPLPLCVALMVQCVGCVLTGCCFGQPTTSAWGLTYAAGTPPWWAQVQAGLLPATAAHSLPVVPTQLLALLLCAAVAGVLLATRRRQWPVGSWLLLQTGLLLLGRFGQGFWRDAASEPVAGHLHPILGGQWLELQLWLLPLGLLVLGIWAWRVRRGGAVASATVVAPQPVPRPGPMRILAVVLAMLVLTALLGQSALTLPEMLVVRALLLAVLVAEGSVALAVQPWQAPRLAGMPLSLVLAGILLLTTAQAPAPQANLPDSTGTTRTTTITGGVLSNQHEAEDDFRYNNSGCSGSQRLAVRQQARAVGGEMAVEKTAASGNSSKWGGGLWVGQQRIDATPIPASGTTIPDPTITSHEIVADVHIYHERHRTHNQLTVDYRVGLHFGALGYYSYFDDDHSRAPTLLMPEFMLRVGNTSVLYGQADLCYGAENAMGAYTTRFGLGSGLGMRNGPRLLLGYARSPHQPASNLGFVSALLQLPGSSPLSLEPYYATDLGRHNSLSLKLNYRITH